MTGIIFPAHLHIALRPIGYREGGLRKNPLNRPTVMVPSHSDSASSSVIWQDASTPPRLSYGEVHVWKLLASCREARDDVFARWLSDAELRQARRFRHDRDRWMFLFSHAWLRSLLASYLKCDSKMIAFRRGPNGKPYVLDPPYGDYLKFNMSHSGKIVLLAFTRDVNVGIDVEETRFLDEFDGLVDLVLTENEQRVLHALPSEHQLHAFFRYWVCKEAFVKATGDGLSRPLRSFEIELLEGYPVRLGLPDVEPGGENTWHMKTLHVDEGYTAAMVIEREEPKILYRTCAVGTLPFRTERGG